MLFLHLANGCAVILRLLCGGGGEGGGDLWPHRHSPPAVCLPAFSLVQNRPAPAGFFLLLQGLGGFDGCPVASM